MTAIDVILLLILIFIGLPVLAYMVMKFGTAGYLRAKNRKQNQKETNEKRP